MADNDSFALELLQEIKTSAKRWFIAFLIMLFIEFLTVTGFLVYLSIPVEEYSVEQDADNGSYNMISGGDIYGGTSEDYIQEKKK